MMINEQFWRYRNDGRDLVLFIAGQERRIGTLSVDRDETGRVAGGKLLTYDPRFTNYVDFFDKIKSVRGLNERDISDILRIKDGFFKLEGYTPGKERSFCIYAYETDPEKRSELLRMATLTRISLGMGLGDFVENAVLWALQKAIDDEIKW
ncbi:MAG: hypothetical protein AABX29_07100 [Nanoarchaeota archaeon]